VILETGQWQSGQQWLFQTIVWNRPLSGSVNHNFKALQEFKGIETTILGVAEERLRPESLEVR
jgi:hypothetical protein